MSRSEDKSYHEMQCPGCGNTFRIRCIHTETRIPLSDELRLRRKIEVMESALRKIAKWHGEFPTTGRFHESGEEMTYSYTRGSNGERDYMRKVAEDALQGIFVNDQ